MAALIKNALIKQLSKFLKNVSANQINISTFKGEGEMKDIQLDENVLMEILELPSWLRITNATCNKAAVKIQWTKLKTNPIIITLDRIELDMETADPPRENSTKESKLFDKESNGPYGFIDKCIDAMQLNIDSVKITIKSEKFNAKLDISTIKVYSTSPNWKLTNDIRNTRLKDLEKEEIILYKEIAWEICRLEAFNIEPCAQNNQLPPTAIKLIMNPSKVQIALKKKLSDKSFMCSTVTVLLNEIYWMANDVQLKSAIGTYNTILNLIKKSSVQKRKYAAPAQTQTKTTKTTQQTLNPSQSQTQQQQQTTIDISKVFRQYDIKETSLHVHISILNIHLYADDNYSGNKLIDGGAMQVLFKGLCIDHYPYHKTGHSLKHWHNYNHIFRQKEEWSKTLMQEFISKLQTILNKSKINDMAQIRLRNSINLMEMCTILTLKDFCVYKVTTNLSISSGTKSKKFSAESNEMKPSEPLSPNHLLRAKNFFLEQQSFNKRPFISSNFVDFNIPSDTIFAHFFFSEFYFPDGCNYPAPCPQVYANISPVLINIDYLTLLWINTLSLSIWREKLIVDEDKKIEQSKNFNQTQKTSKINNNNNNEATKHRPNLHCDTCIDVIMPKVSLSIYAKTGELDSRPSGVEVGFARISITNQSNASNAAELKLLSERVYEMSKELCKKNSQFDAFKNDSAEELFSRCNEIKLNQLAPCFKDYLKNDNLPYVRDDFSYDEDLTKLVNITTEAKNSRTGLFLKSLNRNALNKNANKDLWSISFESMWLDFVHSKSGNGGVSHENNSLIENTSFKLWLVNVHDFYKSLSNTTAEKEINEITNNANLERAYARLSKLIPLDPLDNSADLLRKRSAKQKRSSSVSVSSALIKTQKHSNYLCRQMYSKLNVIGEINALHVRCDHSQLIFLLRLLDTVDSFTQQLKTDSDKTFEYKIQRHENIKKDSTKYLNSLGVRNYDVNKSNYDEENNEAASNVNVSLIINHVEVDLVVNDLRKETLKPKCEQNEIKKKSSMEDSSNHESNESLSQLKSDTSIDSKSCPLFDSTNLNISIKDPMKEFKATSDETSAEFISKQLEKDFMIGYIKFIYGLSVDNPNLRHSFASVSNILLEDTLVEKPVSPLSSVASSTTSITTLSQTQLHNRAQQIINNSLVNLSNTATTSHLTSKASSFFNKTVNTVKNTRQSTLDLLDIDALDNDNDSEILALEQDDTSSLISFSYDAQTCEVKQENTIQKHPSSLSLNSSSTSSMPNSKISSISDKLNINSGADLKQNSTTTPTLTTKTENQTQTNQQSLIAKIKLTNILTYVQADENSLCVLVNLNTLELNSRQSKSKKSQQQILIRFKREEDVSESKDGLLEMIVENLILDVDLPIVAGIGELFEDNDFLDEVKKPTLPVKIIVRNCDLALLNEPHDFSKAVRLNVDKLLVNKLASNEIVISEISMRDKSRKFKVCRSFDLNSEFRSVENDFAMSRPAKRRESCVSPDQLASLVFLLRKSREDNFKLQSRLKNEQVKNKELESEKEWLVKEVERNRVDMESLIKQNCEGVKAEASVVVEGEFVLSEKVEEKIDQLEIERKQFENILRSYQDENDVLKKKMKKLEESVFLLTIERDSLFKKLNLKK